MLCYSVWGFLKHRKLSKEICFAVLKKCGYSFYFVVFEGVLCCSLSQLLIPFSYTKAFVQKTILLSFINLESFYHKCLKSGMTSSASTPISHPRTNLICLRDLSNKVLQLVCGHVFYDCCLENWKNQILITSRSKIDLTPDAPFDKVFCKNINSRPVCVADIEVGKTY